MSNNINKAKVWLGVTYPENMVDGWQDDVSDLLQGIPYAYCIHDKDKRGHETKDDEEAGYIQRLEDRKTHVHWILYLKDVKNGTTTRKHATEILNLLSLPGRVCCPGCEACLNIEHSYEYLIHNTENARKKEKHQYSPDERITGNGFDIERYIVLSEERKLEMSQEICDYIVDNGIKDTAELYTKLRVEFSDDYYQIYKANNAMYDRLCRGVYNGAMRRSNVLETPICGICGSKHVLGSYLTEMGRYWFCSDCQETAYVVVSQMEGDGEEAAEEVREFHRKNG